jgi:hypothetical protein
MDYPIVQHHTHTTKCRTLLQPPRNLARPYSLPNIRPQDNTLAATPAAVVGRLPRGDMQARCHGRCIGDDRKVARRLTAWHVHIIQPHKHTYAPRQG